MYGVIDSISIRIIICGRNGIESENENRKNTQQKESQQNNKQNAQKKEKRRFLHYYLLGIKMDLPPIYGRRTSGILTLPSACRLFSRNAINILGGATTVLFRVCGR